MWQVVCITEHKEHVIFITDNRDKAKAKAYRLDKRSPRTISYEVREVEE